MKNTGSKQLGLNADQTDNVNSGNEQLFTTEDIKNTPFTKVYDENMGGYFVAYGNHVLTRPTKEEKEVDLEIKVLSRTNWKIMLNAIGVIIEHKLNNKEN